MNKIQKHIVTFFGVGFAPKASGTIASLAAIPLYLLLRKLSLPLYLFSIGKIVAAGVWACTEAEKEYGEDPPEAVIDEVAGMLVGLVSRTRDPKEIALAFLIFRAFDIIKPGIVGILDRKVKGGLGIMADDVAAGVLTAACMKIIRRIRR
ncbi:MAG TPA: phosphatidylglycerophosphatase A [Desulfomonilia bacterium]